MHLYSSSIGEMMKPSSRYLVIIKGERVLDDQFQMEWAGPIGPARVKCPDCGQELLIEGVGELACGGCCSQYAISGGSPLAGRHRYAIRRKVVGLV